MTVHEPVVGVSRLALWKTTTIFSRMVAATIFLGVSPWDYIKFSGGARSENKGRILLDFDSGPALLNIQCDLFGWESSKLYG